MAENCEIVPFCRLDVTHSIYPQITQILNNLRNLWIGFITCPKPDPNRQ
jgi:hypothetical protein